MNNIRKSTEVVGQMLGLLMGKGFTTPADKFNEEYPYIKLY